MGQTTTRWIHTNQGYFLIHIKPVYQQKLKSSTQKTVQHKCTQKQGIKNHQKGS
ncbi:hypothetical protein D3C85_867060 [compost metagenome]